MADIITGVALLLVPVLAEYAKLRAKANRAFNLIAGAGIMTLLSASFGIFNTLGVASVATAGSVLFEAISWILLLVGALWATAELSKK